MGLSRYIDLWKDVGHPTLGIRPQTSSIMVPPLGDRAASEFLRQIRDAQAQNPSRPIVYHIFRSVSASNALLANFGHAIQRRLHDGVVWMTAMQASYSLAPCCARSQNRTRSSFPRYWGGPATQEKWVGCLQHPWIFWRVLLASSWTLHPLD